MQSTLDLGRHEQLVRGPRRVHAGMKQYPDAADIDISLTPESAWIACMWIPAE